MSNTDTGDMSHPTQAQIDSLPWVTYIGSTANHEINDGRGATHRIEVSVGELRWDREIHELQNLGADIISISTVTGRTPRIYVTI